MTNTVVFNFFNSAKTMISLCKHFNLDKERVENFIVQKIGENHNIYFLCFDFVKEFNLPVDRIDTTNIFITAKHITTLQDKGSTLKQYGLLNLKDMLEKDTPLSRFLAGKGIKFDVEKKKISIQGMDIDIFRYTNDHQSHSNEYDQFSPKYREAIDRIYIKLYSDKSEIEVFLCGKDSELEKYPYITRHPEFLHNIDNLLKAMQIPPTLSKEWSELQNGQYYILEFDVCIHFLEYILDSIYPDSIYDEKPSFEIFENYFDLLGYTRKHFLSNKVPNDFYYNIFLVKNSLELFFTGKGKEYGQILPTTKILPSDLRITQKSTI